MPLSNAQMQAILAAGGAVHYLNRVLSRLADLPSDQQIAIDFPAAVTPATSVQTVARRLALSGWKIVSTRAGGQGIDGTSSTIGVDYQCSSRCWHSCPQGLSAIRLMFFNFGLPSGNAEAGPGNSVNVSAAIEYPSGNANKQRVYFNGRVSGSIDDGGMLISDPIFVNIPAGAGFWTVTWVNAPPLPGTVAVTNASATVTGTGTNFTAALVGQSISFLADATHTAYTVSAVASPTSLTLTANYTGTTSASTSAFVPANPKWYWNRPPRGATLGEGNNAQYATGTGVDLTAAGSAAPNIATGAGHHLFVPAAILGAAQGTDPVSVVGIGDSIMGGTGRNVTDAGNVGGWLDRALTNYPFINFGQSSCAVSAFTTAPQSWRNRLLAAGAADYTVVGLGTNDFVGGSALGSFQTWLLNLWTAIVNQGSRVIAVTMPPDTTSTDAWATVANQTPNANEAKRTAINDWIRSKPAPLWGVFDLSAQVEVNSAGVAAINGGRWTPNGTPDGLHPSDSSHNLIGSVFPAATLLVPY